MISTTTNVRLTLRPWHKFAIAGIKFATTHIYKMVMAQKTCCVKGTKATEVPQENLRGKCLVDISLAEKKIVPPDYLYLSTYL